MTGTVNFSLTCSAVQVCADLSSDGLPTRTSRGRLVREVRNDASLMKRSRKTGNDSSAPLGLAQPASDRTERQKRSAARDFMSLRGDAGSERPDRPEIPLGIPHVELVAALGKRRRSGVVQRSDD